MKQAKRKKQVILAISYLAAAAAVLGALALTGYRSAARWKRLAENRYSHAFGELVTAVGELDTALQKSIYATSPGMVNAVCTEIFGKAQTARTALGVLPLSGETPEQTAGFLSRVGDYAFSLARSAAAGTALNAEQIALLQSLSETAGVLSENLRGLEAELAAGRLSLTEAVRAARTLEAASEDAPRFFGEDMKLIESEFPEVPALVYDGPFSEHLSNQSPRALEGMEVVEPEEAREIAARFLSLPRAKLYPTGECGGEIPCYGFAADGESGSEISVWVTKQGGRVLNMLSSRPVGSAATEAEAAVETAQQFLARAGYENMALTYHMTQGNVLTANFAYRQGTVLCYSDLVKVSVALDTGKVCGFEAGGYLMGHTQRELSAPAAEEAAAAAAVPDSLEIQAVQLALVPSEGKYETLCYEFKCATGEGRHYLIYVNAATGQQHKILILLEDESGTLTI